MGDSFYSDGPYASVIEAVDRIGTEFVAEWQPGLLGPAKQRDDL